MFLMSDPGSGDDVSCELESNGNQKVESNGEKSFKVTRQLVNAQRFLLDSLRFWKPRTGDWQNGPFVHFRLTCLPNEVN